MNKPSRGFPVAAAAFLIASSLVGGLLGGRVRADARKPEDELWKFGRILALVEDQYVGQTDSKELVEHAIEGLLRTLDPHSNYLSPESFAEMRDEQRGKFHGLGIQITKRGPDKPLTIIAPIDGTPAARAGLRSGDVIAQIEGEPTIDLTVQDAVRRLKGDKGTKVTITIHRPGLSEAFDVTIERDEIPIESIRVAYMLSPEVGVVRIANFNTTTAEELDSAVERLRAQGMTRMILDLRSNPGGLLDQAVQVSERFVPEGELIVYTRGRIPGSNQDFVAGGEVRRVELPLVVLVDGSSASASEIVSGAIQDHDRGLVVGETTFGKGLVQRVIPLRDGGALAVTTAKYYTPSGRLIQRDYSDLDDYYFTRGDGAEDAHDAPAPAAQVEAKAAPPAPETRDVFHTTSGRKVYGGGGITPDYVVDSPRPPELIFRLERENLLFNHAVAYANSHPDLKRGFRLSDEEFAAFRQSLVERNFEFDDAALTESRQAVELRLRAQISRVLWDQAEESRILAEGDPQIQRALEVFDEATRLAQQNALGSHAGQARAPDARAEVSGR